MLLIVLDLIYIFFFIWCNCENKTKKLGISTHVILKLYFIFVHCIFVIDESILIRNEMILLSSIFSFEDFLTGRLYKARFSPFCYATPTSTWQTRGNIGPAPLNCCVPPQQCVKLLVWRAHKLDLLDYTRHKSIKLEQNLSPISFLYISFFFPVLDHID